MVILAGVLGIGIGIFFAFLKEFMMKAIQDESEIFHKINKILKKNIGDILFFYKN